MFEVSQKCIEGATLEFLWVSHMQAQREGQTTEKGGRELEPLSRLWNVEPEADGRLGGVEEGRCRKEYHCYRAFMSVT